MRLYFDPTGPMIHYRAGALQIAYLNPEIETGWRMSRWEMFIYGWRCIFASIF